MQTITITRADLDSKNVYSKKLGSDRDALAAEVLIAEGLGYVNFPHGIYVTGRIIAGISSGIKTPRGIWTMSSIISGLGITADEEIMAGGYIDCHDGIWSGMSIESRKYIDAGCSIEAYCNIVARDKIQAAWNIEAGGAITSLFSDITAGKKLSAGSTISAGILSTIEEKTCCDHCEECISSHIVHNKGKIKAGKIEYQTIIHGNVLYL